MPLLSGTPAQMADFLIHEFWAWSSASGRRNAPGSTVTYSFSEDWTAAERQAASLAFSLWSDAANLSFQEVASGGDTTFIKNTNGSAFATSDLGSADSQDPSLRTILRSTISIDTNTPGWTDLSTFGLYGFETLVHEIGHTLGLGHAGFYNFNNKPEDSALRTDSVQYTLMSYNRPTATGADYQGTAVTGPMLYDIYTIQQLYGANTTTRAGDTVYGFNSTADRDVFDFTLNTRPAFAIYDAGGYNTLDASGFSQDAVISLHAGSFSSIAGMKDNIAIAYNTLFQAAIGGSGNDTLIANDAGNALSGGAGNDMLVAGKGFDTLDGGEGFDTARIAIGMRTLDVTEAAGTVAIRGGWEGDLISIEQALLFDGRLEFFASSQAAHVLRIYETALGREAEGSGQHFWQQALANGTDAQGMARSIIAGGEFQALLGSDGSDEAFVRLLYSHLRDGPVSDGEVAYWTGQLGQGVERAGVLVQMADSAEQHLATADIVAAGLWVLNENAAQVARLYDTLLGRRPDVEGLVFWRTHLEAGGSADEVAFQLFGSAEGQAAFNVEEADAADIIERLYQHAFGRAADADGLAFWSSVLDEEDPSTFGLVFRQISESAEHLARTQPWINNDDRALYGIETLGLVA